MSDKPTMAIQLFTLRDYIQNAEDFDKTLSVLSKWGVKDVQISSIGDIPPEKQREILDKNGMKVCLTHKSFDWMQKDLDDVIKHHRIIGCDTVGIGMAPISARSTVGAVRSFINDTQTVSSGLQKAGMTFNYHNHAFEFYRLDDYAKSMIDVMIEETNPELFHFVPDVAWMHYAGVNPVEILKRMKGRVKVLHLKDYVIDNQGYLRFVSLGKGVVNLRECFETACELGIKYLAYEQDNNWINNDAFQASEESWEFMQELLK